MAFIGLFVGLFALLGLGISSTVLLANSGVGSGYGTPPLKIFNY
ncbi:hypothetical protein [Candidatus Mycoplasma haematohominis]|uniref:Uncharacterized protein n=1 Tax=Candidatus Mycoplasma haematohominis TaxID=1494318 RepID=A0A478FV07_9MOLU|nr:hypothetical protein MHSWG343_08870 [Candidatus Mycoplasma haemohominis]